MGGSRGPWWEALDNETGEVGEVGEDEIVSLVLISGQGFKVCPGLKVNYPATLSIIFQSRILRVKGGL